MSSLSSSYFLFCLIVVFFFFFFFYCYGAHRDLHSFPTRRSSELLAGAALTVDEHRAIGARDPTDHAEHVRDGRAVPDDRRQAVAPGDDLAQRRVLAAQRFFLGGLGDDLEPLGVLPRLGDEVVRTETHG